MNNVHTVADMMTAAARAVQERNTDALFELMRVSRDWLQGADEANAQMELLESLAEVVEELLSTEKELTAAYEDAAGADL